MQTWTIWVSEPDGRGTHHVSSHTAPTLERAKQMALEETSADWGYDPDNPDGSDKYAPEHLHVLGVVEGDVQVVEWNDWF